MMKLLTNVPIAGQKDDLYVRVDFPKIIYMISSEGQVTLDEVLDNLKSEKNQRWSLG